MRIKREQFGPDNMIFVDSEKDRCFRRIVAGLAWPCPPEPGFLAAVAEDYGKDKFLGARPFRLLAEWEADTLAELGRRCLEAVYQYHAVVYGNPGERVLLEVMNRELGKRVSLYEAPYYDNPHNLELYVQMLADLTRPNRKVLHFGEESRLPGYLLALSNRELSGSAAAYPPVAALGYAVSTLKLREPGGQAGRVQVVSSHDWHPLEGRK